MVELPLKDKKAKLKIVKHFIIILIHMPNSITTETMEKYMKTYFYYYISKKQNLIYPKWSQTSFLVLLYSY